MITIIIPVWNAARYIARSIDSIVNQTYQDWELILVNDGSTDNSEEIILPYLDDKRIYLYNKVNGGVSSARNYGIEKSTGDYLLFLDSDDWLAENTCEVLLDEIVSRSADCVVFGFNQTHGYIWAPEFNKEYVGLSSLKEDFDYWLNTELLSSSVNKLYRRDLLDSLFPDNMSFGEDLVFSLNYLSKCEKVCFIKDPLYQHEVYNSMSITHSFNKDRLSDLELVQQSIIQFADKVSIDTNKKYYKDVINSVKSLFRQRSISGVVKNNLMKEWSQCSYFHTLKLAEYKRLSRADYLYARLIYKKRWKILSLMHNINNRIKDII